MGDVSHRLGGGGAQKLPHRLRALLPREIAPGAGTGKIHILPLGHGVIGAVVQAHIPPVRPQILQLDLEQMHMGTLLVAGPAPVIAKELFCVLQAVVVIAAMQAADAVREFPLPDEFKGRLRGPLGIVRPFPQAGLIQHRKHIFSGEHHSIEAIFAPLQRLDEGAAQRLRPLMIRLQPVAQLQRLAHVIDDHILLLSVLLRSAGGASPSPTAHHCFPCPIAPGSPRRCRRWGRR